MSGAEQTRKSWRYPGDKLNRNLLGRTSGLSAQVLRLVVYAVGWWHRRRTHRSSLGPRRLSLSPFGCPFHVPTAFHRPIIEEASVTKWILLNRANWLRPPDKGTFLYENLVK